MPRLLSDVDGKIKHILATCMMPEDFYRVAGIRQAFDDDVELTVAFSSFLGMKRSDLEGLLSGERNVNILESDEPIQPWPQDWFHVYENGRIFYIFSSRADGFSGLSDRIIRNGYWNRKGFSVKPNPNSPIVGGEMIVAQKVFLGNHSVLLSADALIRQRGLDPNDTPTLQVRGFKQQIYDTFNSAFLEGARRYDSSRGFELVDNPTKDHLDMSFTPFPDDVAVVGQAYIPKGALVAPRYRSLEHDLDSFAKKLSGRFDVVRIPAIPSLYEEGSEIRMVAGKVEQIDRQTLRVSYNNVLQERYARPDGEKVFKVYVPQYPAPGTLRDEAAFDPEFFLGLQETAYGIYRGLGADVVPVPFLSAGYDGSLRCSLKVLERTDV